MIFTNLSKDGLYESKDKVLDEAEAIAAQNELAALLHGSNKLNKERKESLAKFLGLAVGDTTVSEGVPHKP